jgi:predicted nuclease of predicted toxin-antitoxin system
MKFLLDQGLPRGAVDALDRLGHEADHVSAIGLHAAADELILRTAARLGAVAVTLDADFHALLALANSSSPSTIRIRIEGLNSEELAAVVGRVALVCATELERGAMVTVDPSGIRVRTLPLV